MLTAESFEGHIGSRFGGDLGEKEPPIELVLSSVRRLGHDPTAPRPDPFTLEFIGPPPVLEQRTYSLRHDMLGEIDIFLVPIGLDPDGSVRYEAVFN